MPGMGGAGGGTRGLPSQAFSLPGIQRTNLHCRSQEFQYTHRKGGCSALAQLHVTCHPQHDLSGQSINETVNGKLKRNSKWFFFFFQVSRYYKIAS